MASLSFVRRVAVFAPSILAKPSPASQHLPQLISYRPFSSRERENEPEKEKKVEIPIAEARHMLQLTPKEDGRAITESEVKAAYRKRANDLHPDKGGTAEEFKELKECYDVALGVARHEQAVQVKQDGLKAWKSNMRKNRKSR
jgi:hypothetical protein